MKIHWSNRFIFSLMAFMQFATLQAQTHHSAKPETFYKRMEGTIGSNLKIISNLKRVGTKIDGNYFYRKMDFDTTGSFSHGIDVYGEISRDKKVSLKEFDNNEVAFTGIFEDHRFSGQWHGPEDSQLYFLLHEHYPEGSIPMEVHYLQSEASMQASNPKAPYAQIELTLVTPNIKEDSTGVGRNILTHIEQGFFGRKMAASNPDSMLIHFESEFYRQFENQNRLWNSDAHHAFNWQRSIEMSVVFNSNHLLCLEYLKHGYSGTGHPVTRMAYQILSLTTGKQLDYDDIFAPDSRKEISRLLTEKLRKAYQIEGEKPLKTAGFFVNRVSPNANIYLGGDGIGFVYNQYELAPPSMGIIDLFLPYNEIQSLLKQDRQNR